MSDHGGGDHKTYACLDRIAREVMAYAMTRNQERAGQVSPIGNRLTERLQHLHRGICIALEVVTERRRGANPEIFSLNLFLRWKWRCIVLLIALPPCRALAG